MAFYIPCSFLLTDWWRERDPSSRVPAGRACSAPCLLPMILIYKDLYKTSHLFATVGRRANILTTQKKKKKDVKLAHTKVGMEKMKL